MPSHWQSEALKAQAVAARTYCLYNKKKFADVRHWDVMKTAASQVYLGIRGESFAAWKAVNDTWGQVLVCRTPSGSEEIFPAYYSSTCGGHTENAANVFGDSFGPLSGVPCPYCKEVAGPAVFFWPMVRFNTADIEMALKVKYPKLRTLAAIKNIVASRQSDYSDFSRLTMVKLDDSNGLSDFVRAEDLRLTIDPMGTRLRSTICKIIPVDNDIAFLSGRGYGHGVGLCQYGAEGMARQGHSAQEILAYYYPGSKLIRIY
jgi:stage II sporulation protein D